jgi:hypothetical protein
MQPLKLKDGMIICGTRTTNGTIITIPPNSFFNGSCAISGSITLAGSATPRVTVAGSNVEPIQGTIVHQVAFAGLLAGIGSGGTPQTIIVKTRAEAATLEFNTGGATIASVTINGYLV